MKKMILALQGNVTAISNLILASSLHFLQSLWLISLFSVLAQSPSILAFPVIIIMVIVVLINVIVTITISLSARTKIHLPTSPQTANDNFNNQHNQNIVIVMTMTIRTSASSSQSPSSTSLSTSPSSTSPWSISTRALDLSPQVGVPFRHNKARLASLCCGICHTGLGCRFVR